jgi:hypothetical protein
MFFSRQTIWKGLNFIDESGKKLKRFSLLTGTSRNEWHNSLEQSKTKWKQTNGRTKGRPVSHINRCASVSLDFLIFALQFWGIQPQEDYIWK